VLSFSEILYLIKRMTTATRSKENACDFPLFKTPLRTPIRSGILSSTTLNDLAFYSNNLKHFKFAGTTSMNDLQIYSDTMITPIRLNTNKFSTPGSIQRRRALGLVNNNSNQICHVSSSSDDLSSLINKQDEPVILLAPAPKIICSHPEDDLPHEIKNNHCYEDTFDDLIPKNERIERMVNQINGINIFAFSGGIENTIRCESPQCSRVDLSTLFDILN